VAVGSAILATAWLLVLYGFISSAPVIGNSPLLYLHSPSISCRQFFGGLKPICSSRSTCSKNY